MKLPFISAKKELKKEVIRCRNDIGELEVGSEEYLDACRAERELSSAIKDLSEIDKALIAGGGSIALFLLYMWFSENHITDTRWASLLGSLKNPFKP